MNRNKSWYDQCLNSLKDEPINLHILEGIEGHVGVKRTEGYRLGTAEFVSHVDDDDYIEPGAYQHCIDLLDQHPEAVGVSTRERMFWEDGKENIQPARIQPNFKSRVSLVQHDLPYIHHVVVIRREAAIAALSIVQDLNIHVDKAMYIALYEHGHHFIFSDKVMYNYRQHDNQAHKKHKTNFLSHPYYQKYHKGSINPGVKIKRLNKF
jgi:hypothetical protein